MGIRYQTMPSVSPLRVYCFGTDPVMGVGREESSYVLVTQYPLMTLLTEHGYSQMPTTKDALKRMIVDINTRAPRSITVYDGMEVTFVAYERDVRNEL